MNLLNDSFQLPRSLGPYTLLKRLAVGGMAEVYVAKAKGLGGFEKLVAVKVIHPRYSQDEHFVRMLVEEAKISVVLTHSNIGQIFDLGCIDDVYFIVMEFIDGKDTFRVLQKASEKQMQLPFEVCAFITSEVCNGLDYAHRKTDALGHPLRIVHRDMSPHNVLLSYSGEVKIVDFGIAKAASRTAETEAGVIKGKYYYMSPEQAWGKPIDHRSDIFSVGIMLYELLTGEMLYQDDREGVLFEKVRRADNPPPTTKRADIPERLSQIAMKALSRNPDDRFQRAQDMGQALSRYLYETAPSFTSGQLSKVLQELFQDELRQQLSGRIVEPPAAAKAPAQRRGHTSRPDSKHTKPVDLGLPAMAREDLPKDLPTSVIAKIDEEEEPTYGGAKAPSAEGRRAEQVGAPRHADGHAGGRSDDNVEGGQSGPARAKDTFRPPALSAPRGAQSRPPTRRGLGDSTAQLAVDSRDVHGSHATLPATVSAHATDEVTDVSPVAKRALAETTASSSNETTSGAFSRGMGSSERPASSAEPGPARFQSSPASAPRSPFAIRTPGRDRAAVRPVQAPQSQAPSLLSERRPAAPGVERRPAAPGVERRPAAPGAGHPEPAFVVEPPGYRPPAHGGGSIPAAAAVETNAAPREVAPMDDASAPSHATPAAAPSTRVAPPALHGRAEQALRASESPPRASYPPIAASASPGVTPTGTSPRSVPRHVESPQPRRVPSLLTALYQRYRGLWWAGATLGLVTALFSLFQYITSKPTASPALEILSVPVGGTVYVDGIPFVEKTPILITSGLRLGTHHQIRVELSGYETWSKSLQLTGAKLTEIAVLQPRRVTLRIESQPDGAHVWVNNVLYGTAPLDVVDLPIGTDLQIKASRAGQQDVVQRYVVTKDSPRPTLIIRLPAN